LKKNLYLITPCSRIDNLSEIKKTIDFNKIKKWIIIYDSNVIKKKKKFFSKHNDIIEFFHKDISSVSGNAQRNFALNYLNKKKNKNFYIYFLDDDNILHKNFYNIINNPKLNKKKLIYTFDQSRHQKIFIYNKFQYVKTLKGNVIKTGYIDIAMFLPNFSLINKIRWTKNKYTADGQYIVKCIKNQKMKHMYLSLTACHYNYISRSPLYKIKERVLIIFKSIF
jgi:hypothetical protein